MGVDVGVGVAVGAGVGVGVAVGVGVGVGVAAGAGAGVGVGVAVGAGVGVGVAVGARVGVGVAVGAGVGVGVAVGAASGPQPARARSDVTMTATTRRIIGVVYGVAAPKPPRRYEQKLSPALSLNAARSPGGMQPLNWLRLMESQDRLERLPSSDGMLPLNSL